MLPFKEDGTPAQQSSKGNDAVRCNWYTRDWGKAEQEGQGIRDNSIIKGL